MKRLLIFILLIIPLSVQAQVVLNLTGQNITSTYTTTHNAVTTFTCTNNNFTMNNTSGYMLCSGDETAQTGNNYLDGQVITGNKFMWTGTVAGDNGPATHACFTGYNKNCVIKYNYQDNAPSGFQMKAAGMANTSGGVAYDVMNDIGLTAIPVKGMKNVNIYNCTFRSLQVMYQSPTVGVWRGLIDIYANTDEGQDPNVSNSSGCTIRNCIFYTQNQIYNIAVHDAQSASGFSSDYNVFYCATGEPIFNYLETEYTFTQWKALGFDQHSAVVNPNFASTTTLIPTARLDYGANLGTTWQTGLATTATWTTGSAPATAVQNGNWQVGAYVFASSSPAYYVATTGSNSNPGTLASPWATIDYGVNHIPAGSTLYIRGGTYQPTGYAVSGLFTAVGVSGKNGTSGNWYQVYAYPGESVVLDGVNVTTDSYERYGFLFLNSSYWHLKGIEIKNINQSSVSPNYYGGQGEMAEGCNNILIENCVSHNNQGPGMGVRVPSGDNCDFLNCDSYNNYNPYGSQGDAADGFDVGFSSNDYLIHLTGCRSWNNSSDGFDMFQYTGYTGRYILTDCWAWHMGYALDEVTPVGGGGNGFKFGADPQSYTGVTKRTAINCVAYDNYRVGFSQQSADVRIELYNNIAYSNSIQGYEFTYFNCADILRNNISYNNGSADIFQSNQTRDHNSWNGHTVTNADFASVTSTLTAARQSSGNLPLMTFLHLASTSSMVHTGVTIAGITLDGDGQNFASPPSLGPWEYGSTPGVILTTDLTINSAGGVTTIATNGGTLQFSVVAVVPTNATDQTVNWSVVNGTGTATISASGLLTATGNGTVTVWGYAHDGSGAYDFKQITISNQLTTPPVTKVWASKGKIWRLKGKVISQRR